VSCEENETVVGGGFRKNDKDMIRVTSSRPVVEGTPGWRVYAENEGHLTSELEVFVICVVVN
jgi:hypothetical protein